MPIDAGGNITRPGPIPVDGQIAIAEHVNAPVNDLYAASNQFPFLDGRKTWRGNQNLNGYRISNAANAEDPQDYVTLGQVQAMISAITTIPTGVILPLTSLVIPAGWLVVNGQEVSRADYPNLWAHAQSSGMLASSQGSKTHGQYGPGDGVTTFTLPNLYADGGYFIRPLTSGRTIGNVQDDENKSHSHGAGTSPAGSHSHVYTYPVSSGGYSASGGSFPVFVANQANTFSAGEHTHPVQISPAGGAESRPKNIAYTAIVKV